MFDFHSLCHLFGTASMAYVLTIVEKQFLKFTSSTKATLALPNLFVYITVMSVQKQAAKLLSFPTVSTSKPDVLGFFSSSMFVQHNRQENGLSLFYNRLVSKVTVGFTGPVILTCGWEN